MKVLFVTDALAIWGGIERVLSDKLNYLVDHYGYDIYIVTADQGDHQIPFPLDDRITKKDLHIRFHQQYQYRISSFRNQQGTASNPASKSDIPPDFEQWQLANRLLP